MGLTQAARGSWTREGAVVRAAKPAASRQPNTQPPHEPTAGVVVQTKTGQLP